MQTGERLKTTLHLQTWTDSNELLHLLQLLQLGNPTLALLWGMLGQGRGSVDKAVQCRDVQMISSQYPDERFACTPTLSRCR